ncbi:hypothetical protein PC116_g1314 [Phytophthora cactorum]|uniref:Uncharacterized protein n=3 Tax=Phytophthora cactorum TaxID=29920 RepID=A0A329RFY7_9STRA|nr:hypothetical protein PC111_g9372 [Phytophthora cactorum]KAG3017265.1 hypothetical protein PC119_g11106 [Phytophthora cactorum]KAG3018325.1 hypothetical protein PC120_g10501 [Phytophthora cactorum]KAG4250955.1 hypothetical protein PC116_g1314 [Phytophthora cactorum]RAW23577.1 hypothetical protein PC110_g19988 [Phytophthora cactorum]
MESHLSTRYRVADLLADDVAASNLEASQSRQRRRQPGQVFDIGNVPAWLGWLFIYTFVLFYFSASRFVTLKSLVIKYSSVAEYSTRVKAAVMGLGFLENFVCTTYFATLLRVAVFFVSWTLFLPMMAPFIADLLLVVHRDMRFSSGLVATIIREREHLKDAPITEEEINTSYVNAVGLMMVATFFGLVRVYADWTDLSRWNPTHMVLSLLVPKLVHLETRSNKCIYKNAVQHVEPNLEEGNGNTSNAEDTHSLLSSVKTTVVSISCASSPVVAYSALNATLNELFANALLPAPPQLTRSNELSDQPWVEMFIHHTKKHELFRNHSLYRRTTGFRGELAFDVDVKSDNPPNVLVIGVESFASKTRATSWEKKTCPTCSKVPT